MLKLSSFKNLLLLAKKGGFQFSTLNPPPFATLDPRGLSQEVPHSVQNYGFILFYAYTKGINFLSRWKMEDIRRCAKNH